MAAIVVAPAHRNESDRNDLLLQLPLAYVRWNDGFRCHPPRASMRCADRAKFEASEQETFSIACVRTLRLYYAILVVALIRS